MLATHDVPAPPTGGATAVPAALPDSLALPLVARALGDTAFPRQAVTDMHAPRLLVALAVQPQQQQHHLQERAAVFGVLARTRAIRSMGQCFFERHPRSLGVVLGAGLSHYFQWLDNGRNQWIDADRPGVLALRERWLPAEAPRRLNAPVDLSAADWWQRLGLPSGRYAPPVWLQAEGLTMHLQPAQLESLLWSVGEFAPPGSMLVMDSFCWLMAGCGRVYPSAAGTSETPALPLHGIRQAQELTAPHPRLYLHATHRVMERYGLPYSLAAPTFRFVAGVPFYALYQLGVDA